MKNQFNPIIRLFPTVESAAVFYANQAKQLEDDSAMAVVFQASCETAEMLLRLHGLETK
jgi:hypothetical protein